MTEAHTVSSEVEVAVDPATAFTAFTEEMDLWWVRGPINFWTDGGRVVEVRCEPGVGGRIMEVLDDPPRTRSSSGLASRCGSRAPGSGGRARSTTSRPRCSFAPIDGGTRVTVEHVIPAGGQDKGGTAWSRVVPRWFGAWCAKRDRVPHEQIDIARLSLGVSYARPAAAARWLADVFGFEPVGDLPAGRTRSPRASTATRGSSSGSATPCSTSSSSTANEPATSVPTCRGSTSTTSRRTSPTPRADGATIVEEIHPYPGSSRLRRRRPRGQPLDLLAGPPHHALRRTQALGAGQTVRTVSDADLGFPAGTADERAVPALARVPPRRGPPEHRRPRATSRLGGRPRAR